MVIKGTAGYDEYSKEVVVQAKSICESEPDGARMDYAEKKRVELHLHTQMSQMDAVSSMDSIVERAVSWGHTAIALTDHGVVQSYPDALKASKNNEKIKIIYGIEGYLVDDSAKIAYGIKDETFDGSFVVFDLETTGLSKYDDAITEIGAVKVENGKITEKWSTFVNPERHIPENIQSLLRLQMKW